jgi:hypothetical protein
MVVAWAAWASGEEGKSVTLVGKGGRGRTSYSQSRCPCLLLCQTRQRYQHEGQHSIQRNLEQMRPRTIATPQEPCETGHFAIEDGEEGAVEHTQRTEASEDIDRVEGEAGRKEVCDEEGFGGEEAGGSEEEEGAGREPLFVVGGEGGAEDDEEERGRGAEGGGRVEEEEGEEEGEDGRTGAH